MRAAEENAVSDVDGCANDGLAVEHRAVTAVCVLNPEIAVAADDTRVLAGDVLVGQNEIAVGAAPDGVGGVVDAVAIDVRAILQDQRNVRGDAGGGICPLRHRWTDRGAVVRREDLGWARVG